MKKTYLIAGTLLSVRALAQTAPAPEQLPDGGRVVAGEADITQAGAAMTIRQSTDRVALDWQSFDVGSEASVDFLQPSAGAVALNRVTAGNASRIFGRITSNGQVFLSNPDGVYFAPTASVDVGGLAATTHAISVDEFMAGRVRFERNGSSGSVINEGELHAALGGYVALLAPEVRNQGVILANLGTVALAAGETFELQLGSNNTLANLRVTPSTLHAMVDNASAVLAPGGLILLSAQAVDQVQGGVIRNTGALEATSLVERGGRIVLDGNGSTTIAGQLDASGKTGGGITVLGKDIGIRDGASLRATGANGGGTVLVGGGWQGSGDLPQATRVDLESGATIDVSATQLGDGGTAVLWSDVHEARSQTQARGHIAARGGTAGGNGGRIETSGHVVDTSGLRVDAMATQGTGGLWLIDPYDYNIDAGAAASIGSALSSGTSVTVTTTAQNTAFGSSTSSADAGDITVNSAITKNGGGDATLTLQAERRLTVDAPITSSVGQLNLVLWSDHGNTNAAGVGLGSGGTLSTNGGHVWIGGSSTAGGSLTWNGLIVGDGASVGSPGGNLNGVDLAANIDTAGGDVLIWAGTGFNGASTGAGIGLDGARTISTGGGNVTLIANRVFDHANTGRLALDTTGRLTLAPAEGSFDTAFNWSGSTSSGNFQLNNTLSANTLTINSIAALGGLDIGRYAGMLAGATPVAIGNASDVTLNSALSVAGPISIHGDNVTVNAAVGSTFANAGVLLKGLRKVTVNGNLTTNAGDITLWSNAEGASVGGIEIKDGRTLSSSGGWITLGGSADNRVVAGLPGTSGLGTALPTGYARDATTAAGIALGTAPGGNFTGHNANIAINSGGGRVGFAGHSTVYGTNSASGNSYSIGVLVHNGVNVNAGSGDIVLHGLADANGGANYYNIGANWAPFNTAGTAAPSTWTTQGGNIRLNGSASGTVTGNTGVSVDAGNIGVVTIQNTGTGGGSVTLSGSATGGTNAAEGLRLSRINLVGASGTVDLQAGAGSIYRQNGVRLNLGAGGGSAVNTTNANVTVSADSVVNSSNNNVMVSTGGTFTLQPTGASFAGTLNWPVFSVTGISGLTLGKPGNAADISFGSSGQTIAGPITVYGGSITNPTAGLLSLNGNISLFGTSITTGGAVQAIAGSVLLQGGDVHVGGGVQAANITLEGDDITVAGAVQATSGTVTIQANGNVTDTGTGSISAGNLRLLGGDVTLDRTTNQVGTLAASGVNGLTYVDSNALTLGTVGGTQGVSASGVISIATLTGDLTVADDVATTNSSSTALTLNAGRDAAAGSSSGGNLIFSGTSTVAAGSGGTAHLLSGAVASSTGLTALVGSGSGRFRYNSDEGTSNYTLALDTGINAIYREQPTLTRAIDAQTITYGGALPTWTMSVIGAQNGDTLAQVFASAPTVSVGGPYATSGHLTAGSHALTATGGSSSSQLGYAVGGAITDGTLTVAQRALTAGFAAASRTYDGTTLATVSASDDRIAGDVLSIGWTSATFGDANASIGKAVTIDGINLAGTDAANYLPASTIGAAAADITPRTLTLSATRVYDGTTALGSVNLGNLVGAETLGYSAATASDAHVATSGKYISGISLADGSNGGLASNYQLPTLDAASAPVTITPRPLAGSATIGGTLSRAYDGTTAAPGATFSGSVAGAAPGDSITLDTSGLTAAYNAADVASANSIAASGTAGFSVSSSPHGSQASDYSFTAPVIAAATATITPRAVTIGGVTAGNRTYDGTNIAQLTNVGSVVTGVGSETVTLSAGGATYSDANVGSGKTVTATGYTLGNGTNGGLASNYQLTSNTATATADIVPAVLIITANDSAKFVTSTDDPAYGGVSYTGFVNGETAAALTGSAVVTRSNTGIQTAGRYDDVLSADVSGLSSGNYSFVVRNGDFTIVPASQLLIRVADTTQAYGSTPTYVVTGAEYWNGSTVVLLTSIVANGNGRFTVSDGIGGSASFTLAPSGALASGAGFTPVGTWQLGASNVVTQDAGNFSNALTVVGSRNVTPAALTASAASGTTKVYDGTTAMPGLGLGLGGVLAGDQVTVSGNGTFASRNAGNGLDYTLGGLTLGGADAGNYFLTGGTSVTGSNGRITPRDLHVTYGGVSRVYDTTRNATVTTSDDRVAGDSLVINRTALFDDPYIGNDKPVSVTEASIGGTDAGNYLLTATTGSAIASITLFGSVPVVPTPGPASLALPDAVAAPNLLDPVGQTGIAVVTVTEPTALQPGVFTVHVPAQNALTGFAIDLPATLAAGLTEGKGVSARREGGGRLPAWLRYDARRARLVGAPGAGAQSLRVTVRVGGRSATMVIDIVGPATH